MTITRRSILVGLGATAGTLAAPYVANAAYRTDDTFTYNEIIESGHQFFGSISEGLARSVEYLFQSRGRPNGYVLGEEGGGAFLAGLRYGEGVLETKTIGSHRLYWQGPSLGPDIGANGDRAMMLVYDLPAADRMYTKFAGVNGSAYLVAGVGVSVYTDKVTTVAPIRTGIGARLGFNLGYLKFTRQPTWNPF
ncbi:DUF1134 domain-containing protein [Lutibaculum baratangense]|uniref:DUF1134 domain-containing protein n=1 Tax=Lutibaculum baratangense AMV1 TaxID=631454 RepID=V4R8Z0_9HYPH|nr:DUF1134 domain-containing protein [Lutibaculum baratangense]ESR22661.1 hypothetical protein N177_3798 [Lutibaculum baratangense AMV1]